MLGLLYMFYIGIFHLSFCHQFILVVALSTISFKFMRGEKYMCFANIGLFIPFILLFFIENCYLSLHFTTCIVLYFCLLCWIWVLVVHLSLKFSSYYSGVFYYLTLKLMWYLPDWVASILFSMVTFHVIGKLDLTILVSNSGVVWVILIQCLRDLNSYWINQVLPNGWWSGFVAVWLAVVKQVPFLKVDVLLFLPCFLFQVLYTLE
jgi:hypothetical protein